MKFNNTRYTKSKLLAFCLQNAVETGRDNLKEKSSIKSLLILERNSRKLACIIKGENDFKSILNSKPLKLLECGILE